jgi:hypothetical protein
MTVRSGSAELVIGRKTARQEGFGVGRAGLDARLMVRRSGMSKAQPNQLPVLLSSCPMRRWLV